MSVIHFPSKKAVSLAVVVLFSFLLANSYAPASGPQEKTASELMKDGIDLYGSGDYARAIEVFKQIEGRKPDKAILSQAYLYISMSYFCQEEYDQAKTWLGKAVETNPKIDSSGLTFPPGYETFYNETKATVIASLTAKELETRPKPKRPVIKGAPGGVQKKKKSYLLIIGVVIVVGVVVAAVLAGGKGAGGGGAGTMTGSIRVTSYPEKEAKVILDGTGTGKTTDCTLSNIAPGSHTVKLVMDGWTDSSSQVVVTTGRTAEVKATLTKHIRRE
jgi:hypothetical protein